MIAVRLRRLRREVLGLNRRNLDYLQALNPRRLIAVADDKLATKDALRARGLPAVPTLAVCRRPSELRGFEEAMRARAEFVLKPARGGGGEGVIVVAGRDGERRATASGRPVSLSALSAHAADILAGVYGVSQSRDEAFLELRLRNAPEVERWSLAGVADVRVLVVRGVPAAAMVRLPTRASRGRANLHAGGLGVEIDLAGGRTAGGVLRGRSVEAHPDSGESLSGWRVPAWNAVLLRAAQAYDAVPLGYFGADVVIDAARGPVILELNARPGLGIQLAARRGLRPVLEAVAPLRQVENLPAAERVAIGRQLRG